MSTMIDNELVQNSDSAFRHYSPMPGPSRTTIEMIKANVSKSTEADDCQQRLDVTALSTTIEFDGTATTIESPFIRSYNAINASSTSKLSRLSIAIRRSLRLGPPRRKAAAETSPTIVVQERQLSPFTEFTDLRPEIFAQEPYGSRKSLHNLLSPKHVRHFKSFLRENNWPITHEIRKDLWRVLVSHGDKEFESSRNFYREQIGTLFRGKVQNFRPAFLSEPGIVVCDHGLKEVGVINLQRLLIVIEYAKPEIRFVPILYPLCAMFLHYHSVQDTFACVNRLLNQGNRFILQSELAVFASRYTILAKRFSTNCGRRLGTAEAKMADVLANWYFWIFKNLPVPYLVRVMDCFLVEGQKMLARAALTILYLWYKQDAQQQQQQATTTTTTVISTRSTRSSSAIALVGRTTVVDEEQQIGDISAEISAVASKVPISVQTFLDIGFSIRRFGNTFLYRKQRHYEAKFRNLERIYTPAFASQIIDEDVARELMGALPARFQLETPTSLFRLSEHGTSFVQFWTRLEEAEQSILIIRSTDNHIFGAYLSSSWTERKDIRERAKTRYFGTGESFVWRLDEELKLPVFYTWCEQTCDNFFMAASDKFMLIGSGGGDAIAIRDELVQGSSKPSTTFQSPELVPGGHFQIDELEVFGISSDNYSN
uniref:TBC1 domain family member 24 n=1 Tax=Globodera rostochiensis TaxID=31243 RepID=A0A914HUA4_GLORO